MWRFGRIGKKNYERMRKRLGFVFGKNSRVALAVLASLIAAAACVDKPDPEGPERLVAAWVEMWNSYDLDQVETLFLNDQGLSYFRIKRSSQLR